VPHPGLPSLLLHHVLGGAVQFLGSDQCRGLQQRRQHRGPKQPDTFAEPPSAERRHDVGSGRRGKRRGRFPAFQGALTTQRQNGIHTFTRRRHGRLAPLPPRVDIW
jgi:hypothetical protein